MTIHVFGSLNFDLVCQTPRLPAPGETILGTEFATVPGGKGANQAVAAARLGASVRMVGRVGTDSFGQQLLATLKNEGIDTAAIQVEPGVSSGVAAIAVAPHGQNHIIVVPGANGLVDESDVQRLAAELRAGDVLLLQFEVPLPAVVSAAAVAREKGATVIVDPAPAHSDFSPASYTLIDWLTPNQTEAEALTGFAVEDLPTAQEAAKILRQQGAANVVIKLGAQGAWVETEQIGFHCPALEVPVVDTVAAGDAFNGGLAAALTEALALPECLRLAIATAALTVTRAGAQPSLPRRAEVDKLLTNEA